MVLHFSPREGGSQTFLPIYEIIHPSQLTGTVLNMPTIRPLVYSHLPVPTLPLQEWLHEGLG